MPSVSRRRLPTSWCAPPPGWRRFRIAGMDCASEEAQIRRALEGQAAVRGLPLLVAELAIGRAAHAGPVSAFVRLGTRPELTLIRLDAAN